MCSKCGLPLRHRIISNLRFCVNPQCEDYHGIPPIDVSSKVMRNTNLEHAFSPEVWKQVEDDIKRGI
jgi:hypothetical protein